MRVWMGGGNPEPRKGGRIDLLLCTERTKHKVVLINLPLQRVKAVTVYN